MEKERYFPCPTDLIPCLSDCNISRRYSFYVSHPSYHALFGCSLPACHHQAFFIWERPIVCFQTAIAFNDKVWPIPILILIPDILSKAFITWHETSNPCYHRHRSLFHPNCPYLLYHRCSCNLFGRCTDRGCSLGIPFPALVAVYAPILHTPFLAGIYCRRPAFRQPFCPLAGCFVGGRFVDHGV